MDSRVLTRRGAFHPRSGAIGRLDTRAWLVSTLAGVKLNFTGRSFTHVLPRKENSQFSRVPSSYVWTFII